jgi:hypothetical protein
MNTPKPAIETKEGSTSNKELPGESRIKNRPILNESFAEKIVIIIITACITGLLIPYIFKKVGDSQARNESMIQSQAKLFEDVTDALIKYQTLAIDVSFYRFPGQEDDNMYQKAYERYSENAPVFFSTMRTLIIKTKVLASPKQGEKLDSFLVKIAGQDVEIIKLHNANGSPARWKQQYSYNQQMLEGCNQLLSELALAMRITNRPLD